MQDALNVCNNGWQLRDNRIYFLSARPP